MSTPPSHCPNCGEALGDLLMKIMMAPLPVPSEVAPLPPELDAWWARAAAGWCSKAT